MIWYYGIVYHGIVLYGSTPALNPRTEQDIVEVSLGNQEMQGMFRQTDS